MPFNKGIFMNKDASTNNNNSLEGIENHLDNTEF